jgi:hypothetical protein
VSCDGPHSRHQVVTSLRGPCSSRVQPRARRRRSRTEHGATVVQPSAEVRSAERSLEHRSARSDGAGEFGEGRREPMPPVDIRAEFVVAATEVLHESVPGTDHPCRAELFEAAHGS